MDLICGTVSKINQSNAPGTVSGEVGGVVVGVRNVISVVGVGRGLHCAVVARRRVEVVVDGQPDLPQVAAGVGRRQAVPRHRRYLPRQLRHAPRDQLRREGSALENGMGGCVIELKIFTSGRFPYPDASLLAAERPQERHQDEEREEGRLEDQQVCKEIFNIVLLYT